MLNNQKPEFNTYSNEPPCNSSFFKKGILGYIIVVLIIASFAVGVLVGQKKSEIKIISPAGQTIEYGELQDKDKEIPEFLGKDVEFRIFWDLWNIIQNKYIDRPVGETQLFYGALEGMVTSLGDPHSHFLEPQIADEFSEELSGKFEGVGMEIGIRNNVLTVISPLAESPAESAGMRAADVIVEIDGYDTQNINLYDAVERIRGPKGTTVNLKIYRPKTGEILDISIVRDTIKIVSVELKFLNNQDYADLNNKKIALIKVTHFNADTIGRFQQAVQDVLLTNPDGIILDLRGNPGGYLTSAVDLADYWVEAGDLVVIEEFSEDKQTTYLAPSDSILSEFKTVVLVNGGSASGSEIVAGALQDHNLAVLIGEKTFGKGSVQQLENLNDGSAVKLTIARWLTPDGRQIDNQGIQPDIEIERTVEDYNNDLDPQLDRAIEYFME